MSVKYSLNMGVYVCPKHIPKKEVGIVENKKVAYYYVRTISNDPMDIMYDGLYTLEKDWLNTLTDLITNDIDAYVYDIVKYKDKEPFEVSVSDVDVNQLPEDVKEVLSEVPYDIALVLKIRVEDVRGVSEIYLFVPSK